MGHVKRTLALILGLAAVLLFAPVARADFHGGKSPYRDAAPLGHASGIAPADGEHDGDGDDHDGDANDQGDSHDHSGDSGSHGEHDNETDDHDSDEQASAARTFSDPRCTLLLDLLTPGYRRHSTIQGLGHEVLAAMTEDIVLRIHRGR